MGTRNCIVTFAWMPQTLEMNSKLRAAACTLAPHERYSRCAALTMRRSFAMKATPPPMNDDNERDLGTELARLQQEHRDLDAAIEALHHSPAPDLLRLQRLKKRKLQLRDRISFVEDQITPDIIA